MRREQKALPGFTIEVSNGLPDDGGSGEHIDSRAAEMTGAQAVRKRSLVDDTAARSLDQDRSPFHRCKLIRADQSFSRGIERHMQRHHVGASQQFGKRRCPYADLVRATFGSAGAGS